jgi:pilus assembly protein Flp/PilA
MVSPLGITKGTKHMFAYAFALLERVKVDRRGVTALEYGVLAAVIVVALGTAATALSGKLTTTFTTIGNTL